MFAPPVSEPRAVVADPAAGAAGQPAAPARQPGPGPGLRPSAVRLAPDLDRALQARDWPRAAEIVNGYSAGALQEVLATLNRGEVASLYAGALDNPGVGRGSAVAQASRAAYLDVNYENELRRGAWAAAALYLNGFSSDDILRRLQVLDLATLRAVHDAAAASPEIGGDKSHVTELAATLLAHGQGGPAPVPAGAVAGGGLLPPMSATDKLVEAFNRADISAAVRAKILSALTPQALVGAVLGFAVVFLASQFTPVGWAADLTLGLSVIFVGNALLTATRHLVNFADARNATTTEQLDRAGQEFARAVAEIEIDAILLLLTHSAGKGAPGGTPYEGPPPRGLVLAIQGGRVIPVVAETIPVQIAGQLGVIGGATVLTMAGRPRGGRPGAGPRARDFEPPVRDHEGKVGGELPRSGTERTKAVRSWTREELESAAGELERSIAARQAEQGEKGETSVGALGQRIGASHRVRIEAELELLLAIRRQLGGS
jgi:hypothetical protein